MFLLISITVIYKKSACYTISYLQLYRSPRHAYLIEQKYTLSLSLQKAFPTLEAPTKKLQTWFSRVLCPWSQNNPPHQVQRSGHWWQHVCTFVYGVFVFYFSPYVSIHISVYVQATHTYGLRDWIQKAGVQYRAWTRSWRGACSPPGHYWGALEQASPNCSHHSTFSSHLRVYNNFIYTHIYLSK